MAEKGKGRVIKPYFNVPIFQPAIAYVPTNCR
jgi:hypothetical protein